MANISVVNLAGPGLVLKVLTINGTNILLEEKEIIMLQDLKFEYLDKDWSKFSRLIMKIKKGDVLYEVDLNRDHYFGGGDYRYPGSGSKVRYILSGFSADKKSIQINYAYNSPDLKRYNYSNDEKYLQS